MLVIMFENFICLLVDIILQTVLWLCYQIRLHCTATRIHQGQICILSTCINISNLFHMLLKFFFFLASRQKHFPNIPEFDFHKYMVRALEADFKKVVGIR